ncbi:MAG: response regulator [Pontiellaceae bacterium]|nr:response regulator [Pontiellaceae bacterium]MBN2786633.1 response regulator [Pontiellaceae bacterium]
MKLQAERSQESGQKRWGLSRGIYMRTAMLAWIVSVGSISLFGLQIIPQQKQVYFDVLESKAHVLISSVHDVAASAVVTEDYSEVVEHCMEIIMNNESISFIVLEGNDGLTLVHKRDGWSMEDSDGGWHFISADSFSPEKIHYSMLVDDVVFETSERFDYSGINWGMIHVGLSLDQYEEGLSSIIRRTAYVGLVSVLVGLLASLLYARRFVTPILSLEQASFRVAAGDLGVRANVQTRDELQSLAEAFNSMTQSIQDRERRMQQQNQGMAHLASDQMVHSGNLEAAARRICEACYETMGLSRVGIWIFDDEAGVCRCLNVLDCEAHVHGHCDPLPLSVARPALKALGNIRVIAAENALEDERFAGLLKARMLPPDTHSAICSIVRLGGELAGLLVQIRRESQGGWSLEEENFAGSASDLVALAIEAHDRNESRKDLLKAKEAAEAASEAKSRFLANMSHEIRTPLNGVVGMLKLLRESSLSEQQARFVSKGILSSEALMGVINDVLDFSKIEAGMMEIEDVPFNLHEMVENTVQMFAQRAEEKHLELVCSIEPGVPDVICGDSNRLGQVLINLIGNAIKFTNTGEVSLLVSLDSAAENRFNVRFEVRDTGIGMTSEVLDRIFEPFHQVDNSTTRSYGGTGLGLGISRQLVELMGGAIEVESALGEGSSFQFCLEYGKCDACREFEAESRKLVRDVRGLRALVVDDHETTCASISSCLENWGFETVQYSLGNMAVDAMKESALLGHPYDLVVADWRLPDISGEDLGRQIRRIQGIQATNLIALGPLNVISDSRWRAAGFDACVPKPARQSELYDAVMTVLNGRASDPLPVLGKPAVKKAGAPVQPMRDLSILLVEDNEINQEVAREILRLEGYRCDVAGNGVEALRVVASKTYDLILMDCMMPEMDGYEATRQIRSHPSEQIRKVPIVALTANAMKGDRELCLAAGMDDYLSKPLDPQVTLEMVAKWCGNGTESRPDSPERAKPAHQPVPEQNQDMRKSFDREVLLTRCMGKEAFMAKLINSFITQIDRDVEDLERAISTEDFADVKHFAHRIRGVAANMAMEMLRDIASSIEHTDTGDGMAVIVDGFTRLTAEIEVVKDLLGKVPVAGD